MGRIIVGLLVFTFALLGCLDSFARNIDDQNYLSTESKNLIKKSEEISLYKKAYWKILLHYNGSKSSIKDDVFFLAKDGYKNPQSELKKTIEEFFRTDLVDDRHAICRYPARLKWLTQELQISQNILPKVNCTEFKTYLKNTSASQIDMVFASENVNNLMSMMGHIFFKVSGKKDGRDVAHSLSYFANFADRKISFIFDVIFSGTPGVYILEPYSKKIREYNDGQKRSLWEYKLNFKQEQIDALMFHIWEMKQVNASYNFINHNCGSALLYLLYVAEPKLQEIYSPIDAPLDIVKNLSEKNYITNITVLPSDNYKFKMLESNFLRLDKKIMKDFLNDGDEKIFDSYQSLQQKSNVLYGLETVLNYKLVNKNIEQEKYNSLYKKIRKISAELPENNLIYDIKNPLKKSNSSLFTLGYKNQGRDNQGADDIINLGFYPVYNNFNGNNSEYFNEFELQLANFEGNYYSNSNKFRFNNFDLIKIKNVIPYDSLIKGLSGGFKINFERERFDSQSNKMFPNLTFGAGVAENFSKNIIIYSLLNFGYSYFQNNNVGYTNPEIGLILKEGKYGKMNAKYTKYFSSNDYKYREIVALDQTFFLLENHDVMFSAKYIKSDLQKGFNVLNVEYQYHF